MSAANVKQIAHTRQLGHVSRKKGALFVLVLLREIVPFVPVLDGFAPEFDRPPARTQHLAEYGYRLMAESLNVQ
jgi:hypothetical protein